MKTTTETAQILNCTRQGVQFLIRAGALTAHKHRWGGWLISERSIRAYQKIRRVRDASRLAQPQKEEHRGKID